MNAKSLLLSALVATLVGVTAPAISVQRAERASVAANAAAIDPAAQLREAARHLRRNDVSGFLQALVPPSHFQEFRIAYEAGRAAPITDEQRARFAEKLARFTAPDAVDQLMTEIEPKLEEARPKQPGAVMMGMGALQMAIASPESELTEEDRAALQMAMPEIQAWANGTDFLDSATLRQALALLTDAARSLGVDSLDELKSLSMNDAMGKAGRLLAAGKQAVALYGLDIDDIVDSLQLEVISINGDQARVRATVLVFDAPFSREVELERIDGRWYGKHAVAHFNVHSHLRSKG